MRTTKAQLQADFDAVVAKVNALSVENAQLRTLNAQWAHQASIDAAKISQLKAHTRPSLDTFAAHCRAYCEEHGVRSVPAEVVREWRTSAS